MKDKDLTIKKNIALAFRNHQKNNFKVAENIYKKILKLNPNHFESIFLLGSLLLQTRNFNEAIQLLNKAIQIRPDHANSYHNLGLAFVELGEYKKAMNYSKKAIQIQPSHVEAYNNLGNILKELREFSQAKNCYLQAIQVQPNHAGVYNNLGNTMKELGEFCNLPWNRKCLEFYKRKDLVSKTASNIQIRKAIYKEPMNKNLPYKKFLDKYGKQYSWFN